MSAAKWLGIPVPTIPDVGMWWIYKALDYMSAEAEAQEDLANRKK